jgi:hypothetical protein
MDLKKFNRFYEIVIFVYSVPGSQARWPLAEALSNQPICDSVTFKAGIAHYRLGKLVSAWRMHAISKWRYSLYGRGIADLRRSRTKFGDRCFPGPRLWLMDALSKLKHIKEIESILVFRRLLKSWLFGEAFEGR